MLSAAAPLSVHAEASTPRQVPSQPGCVYRAQLDGVVNPGTADYLESAVRLAADEQCTALLVVLDTPGGLLDSTRRIVRAFMGASVPVIVFVSPGGARAGSAGMFITIAAHVAAMAPGSNIGAAHPVGLGGEDPKASSMADKIENDTAAFARSVAEERGRNVEWVEKAVRESVSATATEAEKNGVVDVVARDEASLLRLVHGRTVRMGGEERILQTKGAMVRRVPMTIQQRALTLLGHPTLAYGLLMLGLLGLLVEFYHPGMLIPGAVGVFCLLLAAIGLNLLPVNFGAITLIAIALILFVAETQITSFGLLTVAGVACLLLGSALLIDRSDPDFFVDPSVSLSWGAVFPLALTLGGGAALLAFHAARAQRAPSTTGREGMIGELGVAGSDVDSQGGHVRVHGERWQATAEVPIAEGTKVRVVGVSHLRLQVVQAEPGADG